MSDNDDFRCEHGYEQCAEFSQIMRNQRAEIDRLKAALDPLAALPVGAELYEKDEYLDTVLYKNAGKAITARDILDARSALGR